MIARIAALSVIPEETHERVLAFSCFGIMPIARNTPIRRATTGFPRKVKMFATTPVAPRMETTEAIPIRMIGRRIGAKLWSVPGSFPYFFCSYSRVYSLLASIWMVEETFFAQMIATNTAGMETRRPTRIVRPRSAPSVPAMAIGPGVGGTRQCVA